ncbi:hypothetical protein [Desulfosporosinus sp. Sb-LF]|uniref:hypothetical protein n=1 Tax=Desulfosporosinus sp. Sb-LF TaxID=2560027 RepID=UPI001101024C|nr:hypothetical protein [Desulfosporosinus sp. Sb-LF]TGE31469.1 hypothetical protein E4K68_17235 [Desulfosporosinus sp. Sb-LF]
MPINTPASVGMSIQFVALTQLRTAASIVLPSSAGLQVTPAAVSLTLLSTQAATAPAAKTKIELIVKLLPLFLSRPDREFEVQAVINTTAYDKTMVISFDVEDSLNTVGRIRLGFRYHFQIDTLPKNERNILTPPFSL